MYTIRKSFIEERETCRKSRRYPSHTFSILKTLLFEHIHRSGLDLYIPSFAMIACSCHDQHLLLALLLTLAKVLIQFLGMGNFKI